MSDQIENDLGTDIKDPNDIPEDQDGMTSYLTL